jgi:hypothetical protein
MLTEQELQQIALKGITEEQLQEQLKSFEKGFPFLRLQAAASTSNGIIVPTAEEQEAYVNTWNRYKQEGHCITKFVPASGAASRMFKAVFEFVDADYDVPTTDFEKKFFQDIEKLSDYRIKVPEGLQLGRVDNGHNYSRPGMNQGKPNRNQNMRQRNNQKNFRKK